VTTANSIGAAVVIVAVASLLLQRRDRRIDKAERKVEREQERAERQREREQDQAVRDREREQERLARNAELEPKVLVRVSHTSGLRDGVAFLDGGAIALEYRLTEIVSESDRAESVRDVVLEHPDGTPVRLYNSRLKAEPLTRDRPVHRSLVVPTRGADAVQSFRVAVELATGRRFYSEPLELDSTIASTVRRSPAS
jgi:hypothetical protein